MNPEEQISKPDSKGLGVGKTDARISTELSKHRTELSEHRTQLSEHRTQLSDARSHLSNERTHLSYLRTGVALISFGITLNRFSLFLLQSDMMPREGGRILLDDSKNVGIGMVALGSILLLWSVRHFIRTAKAIETATFKPVKWSLLFFTLVVIVIGTSATAWMILG